MCRYQYPFCLFIFLLAFTITATHVFTILGPVKITAAIIVDGAVIAAAIDVVQFVIFIVENRHIQHRFVVNILNIDLQYGMMKTRGMHRASRAYSVYCSMNIIASRNNSTRMLSTKAKE